MTDSIVKKKIFIPFLLLQTAAAALAWIGTDFSPGFSEGLIAAYIIAGAAALLCQKRAWGRVVFLTGVLCVPVGTYIYAAGEDHLSICLWISVLGTITAYGSSAALLSKEKQSVTEHMLRAGLLFAGTFSLLCGVFSTALLPVGTGVLLCFAARYTKRALPYLTLIGLLLTDLFLLSPMLFGGVL